MAIPPMAEAEKTFVPGQIPPDRIQIHNEQMKLRATLFNTVAAGFAIAGVITPLASASSGTTHVDETSFVLMAVWIVGAVILHYGAQLVLETLK